MYLVVRAAGALAPVMLALYVIGELHRSVVLISLFVSHRMHFGLFDDAHYVGDIHYADQRGQLSLCAWPDANILRINCVFWRRTKGSKL